MNILPLAKHVKIGITGLSGAGKTVFLLSLVNNLMKLSQDYDPNSPIKNFNPYRGKRIKSVEIVGDKTTFPYEALLRDLKDGFPRATEKASAIRLKIKYFIRTNPVSFLLGNRRREKVLYLDLTDYPGDRLLEIPLLNMTFAEWSKATLGNAPTGDFTAFLKTLGTAFDPIKARQGVSLFKKHDFFPLPASGGSFFSELEKRFERYKKNVVKKFCRDHLYGVDRQIILVDFLSAFSKSQTAFEDMKRLLATAVKSFRFKSFPFKSIGRIIFLGTKADHILQEDRSRYKELMKSFVLDLDGDNFLKSNTESVIGADIIAGLDCTQSVFGKEEKRNLLKGVVAGEEVLVDPGTLPSSYPLDFKNQGYDFVPFGADLPAGSALKGLPNLHLAEVLNFILEDKLT